MPTEQFIAWTVERFRNRRLVITTSFGMEGCALIDMYAARGAAPTVAYLDTMFLFPETYVLRDRMVQRYPLITFVNRGTSLTPEEQEVRYGPQLWRRAPDLCCRLRKVEPMQQALVGADVWITAISRSQGNSRSEIPLIAWDWQYQVLKICPLAGWDRPRVWEYVRRHSVPYNELHERGYPSIGCTHCTLPVPGAGPAEYSREGRWAGTEKAECGLHLEPGVEPQESSVGTPKAESKVEIAKRNGRHLRGSIAETLASDVTHFEHDDVQLLKFHGTYQQDSRDERKGREALGQEKAYSFMVRVAIPAGVVTAEQYLALERIADRHANGTLRVTTRQGFQFHGVLKGDLKSTIAAVNQELLTTISACGDVQRNVMGCSAPLADTDHTAVRQVAEALARELRPSSRAYHEIWLEGEKQLSSRQEEPFYGDRYLPRKFKTAVGLSIDNCVDIYSQDVGLLAMVAEGRILGFNLLVGGGLGMTHNKGDTTARLAQPLGFVPTAHGVEAVRIVASIFRDHGNRSDRRHARLKYLIAEWGLDRFREEFQHRASFQLAPAVSHPPLPFHDHLGRHRQADGRFFYGLFIQSGRIADTSGHALKTALHRIVTRFRPGVRLTAQQNLLLTDLDAGSAEAVELLLRLHGVTPPLELSAARRFSLACPALPTCGLAVAESERVIPGILAQFEMELESLGLREVPLTIRMTGCPNGCARPYTADLAFVGRSLGLYHVYVGGGLAGDRLVDLYRADVPVGDLLPALRPLLTRWAAERLEQEGLGDFYQRIIGRPAPRTAVTGREQPTYELVQLQVTR